MNVTYNGEHSVNFINANGVTQNTWNDWRLIPTKKPTVAMPSTSGNYIEIPGMNGSHDITNYLTGGPTFSDRSGSWEFRVADVTAENWDERINKIASFMHGQKVKCVLKDDPMYYYEGRVTLSNKTTEGIIPSITISYRFAPFKRMTGSNITKF